MAITYIGVGSNVGNRAANIQKSQELLQEASLAPIAISPVYETAPRYVLDQPYFLNAVFRLHSDWQPQHLLTLCQHIEQQLQRVRTKEKGPRSIDLDILLYDDCIIDNAQLTIPHPCLQERRFVLQPLCDLDPHLIHPVSRVLISQLCAQTVSQELREYIVV